MAFYGGRCLVGRPMHGCVCFPLFLCHLLTLGVTSWCCVVPRIQDHVAIEMCGFSPDVGVLAVMLHRCQCPCRQAFDIVPSLCPPSQLSLVLLRICAEGPANASSLAGHCQG